MLVKRDFQFEFLFAEVKENLNHFMAQLGLMLILALIIVQVIPETMHNVLASIVFFLREFYDFPNGKIRLIWYLFSRIFSHSSFRVCVGEF